MEIEKEGDSMAGRRQSDYELQLFKREVENYKAMVSKDLISLEQKVSTNAAKIEQVGEVKVSLRNLSEKVEKLISEKDELSKELTNLGSEVQKLSAQLSKAMNYSAGLLTAATVIMTLLQSGLIKFGGG